ncbi:MAG: hypothetical protein U9Q76_08290, partial [candidate division WOR-3 bacterium]|nr:hypothetical protein [candidate division WOR-3 bacterium]
MNLLFVLMPLLLQGGIIKEAFRVGEAEPNHHQVCLRTAMASDGRFGIAWVDSLQLPDHYELNMFVRFFDRDGNPLTEAYQITKIADTNWIYWPCLEIDSAGNAILLWVDNRTQSNEWLSNIRFQRFEPDGTPVGSSQILVPKVWLQSTNPPVSLSLNNNGEFAVAWCEGQVTGEYGYYVFAQRFNMEGYPLNRAFLASDTCWDTTRIDYFYPGVALNDAGDLIVTWIDFNETSKGYPCFQVFDANDEPILPWDPLGNRLDDGGERAGACRPEPHWLDNDRFLVFWTDYCVPPYLSPLLGRVFSERGLIRHPIRLVMWSDTLWLTGADPRGQFSTAIASNDSFAYTHTRNYYDYPDTSNPWKTRTWEHGAGFLGQIVNNEPWRRTNLFEYTPPWGADTVNSFFDNWPHVQPSAVACCDDRIVWVYSRLNTDTIFEAYALITDWDMGVGVVERPVFTQSPIQLS